MALPLITDPYTGASYVGYVNFTQPFNGTYFIEIRSSDNTLVSSQQEIPYVLDVDFSTFKLAFVETDQLFLDFPLLDCVIFSDVNDGSVYYSFSANYGFSSTSLSLGDFVFRDSAAFYRHFGIFDSLGGSVGSVDLTPVLTALTTIENRVNMLPDFEASSAIVSSALMSLDAVEINNLHEDIVSLGTQLSTVTVPLQSLNGNGTEFKDGMVVNVLDRLDTFTVLRSYMSLVDSNSYTIAYDLESLTGLKVTCPESLLTLYVAPVVTP